MAQWSEDGDGADCFTSPSLLNRKQYTDRVISDGGGGGDFCATYGELGMSKRRPLSYILLLKKGDMNMSFFDLISGVLSTLETHTVTCSSPPPPPPLPPPQLKSGVLHRCSQMEL